MSRRKEREYTDFSNVVTMQNQLIPKNFLKELSVIHSIKMNLSKRSLHHGKEDNTVRVPLSIRIKNVTMICRDKPPVPIRYMTKMKSSKSNCSFIFTSLF